MTLNIWNYTRPWAERRERIVNLILTHQPDAVALQETRHDWRYQRGEGQGDQLARLTGYHPTWVTGQVYLPLLRVDEGLTTLTRAAPLSVDRLSLSRHPHDRLDENQRACLGVSLECDGKRFFVYNTHFSLSPAARRTNAEEVKRFVERTSRGAPSVVLGDLNAEPSEPALMDLLEGDDGFTDCWTRIHQDDPGYTYSSSHPVKRIDYVLGRGVEELKAAFVVGGEDTDGIYPSDHLGIVVDVTA